MSKNKLDYVMKKVVVTKENLERVFAQYPTKRRVRASQEKNLLAALKKGKSFPVMYVNRGSVLSPSKLIMLDGNHRLEALRSYFGQFPEASVELNLGVYNISDPELEREKFLELNNIVKPSSDDVIQQYADDNDFLKTLLRSVDPLSIYGGTRKPLTVRVLMSAYIQAKKPRWVPGAMNGQTIVAHMENMDRQDLANIKGFLKDYQEALGILTKDSVWMKGTVFTTMLRIWYVNKSNIDIEKMIKKFRLLINHPYVLEFSRLGGREACLIAGEKFVEVLNNRRNGPFVLEQPLEEPIEVLEI